MTDEPTAEVPTARASARAPGADRPSRGRTASDDVRTAHPGGAAGSEREPVTTALGTVPPSSTPPPRSTPLPAGPEADPRASSGGTSGPAPGATSGPAPEVDGSAETPTAASPLPRRRRWVPVVLSVLLVASLGLNVYLVVTARAYVERLAWTEEQAQGIGEDLTLTRSELEGARAEIDALGAQLTTAQERITALADEKAQIGDDREAQRQLLDYQARVSEAAGTVASALDRCVQGQDQLITYLEDAESYDPTELSRFSSDVEALCQSASDANEALQTELADR